MSKAKSSRPPSTPKEVLIKARALLAKGWIQGIYAKTTKGRDIDPLNRLATRFCALGAIERAAGQGAGTLYDLSANAARLASPTGNLVLFNDASKRTKQEVLQVFDKAIASL